MVCSRMHSTCLQPKLSLSLSYLDGPCMIIMYMYMYMYVYVRTHVHVCSAACKYLTNVEMFTSII